MVLPVLIILLLGVVEVTLFLGRYLDVLDLTREAARFASARDSRPDIQASNCRRGLQRPRALQFLLAHRLHFLAPANG